MAKKFLTRKQKKKINQALSHPSVRNVGQILISYAAISGLRRLSNKFPAVKNVIG